MPRSAHFFRLTAGRALFAALLLSSTASPALAQSSDWTPGFGVRGAAGFWILGGDDFEGVDDGTGFGGALHYALPSGLAILVSAQRNGHGIADGLDSALSGVDTQGLEFDGDVGIVTVGLEPRYYFDVGPTAFRPFAGARLAWVRAKLHMRVGYMGLGLSMDAFGYGWSAGLTAGGSYQVSPGIAVEAGLSPNLVSTGEFEWEDEKLEGSDLHGRALGLFGGLVLTIPSR